MHFGAHLLLYQHGALPRAAAELALPASCSDRAWRFLFKSSRQKKKLGEVVRLELEVEVNCSLSGGLRQGTGAETGPRQALVGRKVWGSTIAVLPCDTAVFYLDISPSQKAPSSASCASTTISVQSVQLNPHDEEKGRRPRWRQEVDQQKIQEQYLHPHPPARPVSCVADPL